MARLRLSRFLGGIFIFCFLASIVVLIGITTAIVPNTAVAGTFVSIAPTPCARTLPSPNQGLIQNTHGTIKAINTVEHILQIVPSNPPVKPASPPAAPINAVYSSTTHVTEQTLITTAPALTLKAGVSVSIQAIQNPNNTFTATLITLTPGNQPDNPNPACATPRLRPTVIPGHQPNPQGNQFKGDHCFAGKSPSLTTPTPVTGVQQPNCRMISGTVVSLKGNILTITNRQHLPSTIVLTTGPNATKIIQTAPAILTALKIGQSVTVTGPVNKGVITALRITIGIPGVAIS